MGSDAYDCHFWHADSRGSFSSVGSMDNRVERDGVVESGAPWTQMVVRSASFNQHCRYS